MLRILLLTSLTGVSAWADEDLLRQASEVLATNCLGCHGGTMKMSDLDLRSREAMLKGGTRGPAMVPGDPENSRMLRLVMHTEQPSMPPGKKLQNWQIAVLRNWIGTGAPLQKPIGSDVDAKKAMVAMEERPIQEKEREIWSFRPVRRLNPPTVSSAAWMKNPIDAFLLKSMEQNKLRPSAAASRRTLARRAYLDLWGLPPTPDQVEEFVNDKRADAWPQLIEKLLSSPHYGERWARHWLDLVRYADSGGFEYDRDRPDAWRYRDWVVKSFSNDLPYDQFVKLQIAGDEIAPKSPDALVATGYLRHGPEANIKTELTRMDELDDILSVTSNTFLGLTVGCARCHNHKFDPIPQKDYYRMQAVFFATKGVEIPLVDESEQAKFKEENKRFDELVRPLRKELEAIKKPYRDRMIAAARAKLPEYVQEALRTPPEKRTEGQRLNVIQVEKTRNFAEEDVLKTLSPADREKYDAVERKMKEIERGRPRHLASAMAITEGGREAETSYFLHRGSIDNKGSVMNPGVLSVITLQEPDFPMPPKDATTSHRRKVFAEWLASPGNPLFTRVMVNRIWQHHFGEGIVRTPSNVGKTGDAPSHPELLDWLASEFVKQNWSIKAMHRLMMNSNAYLMASDDVAANMKIDPENRYFWRMPRQRLEGEIIRDSILAVSGTLDRGTGGPGVFPYIDPSLWQGSSGRMWPGKRDDDPSTWRRSLYVHSKRSIPLPMLDVFDKPDSITSCARRNRSTIAPQALILMNNSFVRQQAKRFADRLEKEAGKDTSLQVDRAFLLSYSRSPEPHERATAIDFVKSHLQALVDFCQALFNSNEFVYAP